MRYRYMIRADIAQMKANGYDPATIEVAEQELERLQPKFAVMAQINAAFAGVKLGHGIGLREANGLDDYADQDTLAGYRLTDEKQDWQAISVDDLNRYHWGFSYMDAEGLRFHLPAFLMAELRGEYIFDLISTLVNYLNEHSTQKFSLLSWDQRQAVREFLQWAMDDADYKLYRDEIIAALIDYWQ